MDAHDLPTLNHLRGVSAGAIPPRLLASWKRSERYGVPLDEVQPLYSGTYTDESLFSECGHEVLAELQRTLASEPIGLMLTDAEGLVLTRLVGDSQLIHGLDQVHLAPGFSYSEREAGTNGLGLALADRVPSLVRAGDHYASSLRGYTCAAAPIFDPVSGRLEGAVNLTTWSDAGSELLLALSQAAATSTSNLMLARSQGHRPRRAARGQVFRIEAAHHGAGTEWGGELSPAWSEAVALTVEALGRGRVVAAVGERGAGRATLLAQAERLLNPHDRLLAVRAPEPHDIDSWLALWTPELSHEQTGFVICDTDDLPMAAAERLRAALISARRVAPAACGITAESFDTIPAPLASLVETVVQVPPLRERIADILPLADHLARRARGRRVDVTASAARALTEYSWPGNVAELATVMKDAAVRTDTIDLRHLPPELLSRAEHLPRIKAFERDEMVRVLTRPGVAIEDAAAELGMSRATVYRKLAVYGIRLPKAVG